MATRFPAPHAASRFRDPFHKVAGLWILKTATAHLRSIEGISPFPDEDGLFYIVRQIAIDTEPRKLYPGTTLRRWEPGLDRDRMDALFLQKCRRALIEFKPKEAPFSVAQNRQGGTRSRRTRKALIVRYRALQARMEATGEVLTRVEIAKRLKVNVSTVYRMLAELKPTPVTVLAPPSHILDLLDREFPETGEFHRHALVRVLDQRPDLLGDLMDLDQMYADMIADYEAIPALEWAVAA